VSVGTFSTQIQRQIFIITTLFAVVVLACGPIDRLQGLNQQQQAVATGAAIIRDNSQLATNAYQKLQTLSSYRLESRHLMRDHAGHEISRVVVEEHDSTGNIHTQTQTSDGSAREVFIVDGHTYLYDLQYEGWIDSDTTPPAEVQSNGEISVTDSMHLLTQFGAAPTKSGHETLNSRPATRYRLGYVVTEMAEIFGQELADSPLDLRGTLWVDDETGVLLKSEILLYQGETNLPTQEFVLEISQINDLAPIEVPLPLIDPAAIVAATATAQAWTILDARLDYRGEQVSFEVIPLQVTQIPNSSPRRAEVQLLLRQLPDNLFGELEPFLAQLREQLTLSIPNRNLVVTSSGYRLENSNRDEQIVNVVYLFNADLEEFSHAELIISGVGNPLFSPVPIEEVEN
jgi:hypothetical protein